VVTPLTGARVVLCDADGNLFPSEEPAFAASAGVVNAFLTAHRVDRRYDSEELRLAATGMNFRSIALALALEYEISVAPEALEVWVEREKREVVAHLVEVLRPDPEVLGPLHALAEHYGLAAVSSSADARIAACFEVTGMASFFPPDRRFSAEDSLPRPTSKPDPAIYLHAGDALGIRGPEGVAVEDSVAGATSAVAAGFPTIGNLQFVQLPEREARRAAFERIGVAAVVTSWQEALPLLPEIQPSARSRADF